MADLSLVADTVRSNPTRFESALQRYLYALNTRDADAEKSDYSDESLNYGTDAVMAAEDCLMREPACNLQHLWIKADLLFSDSNSIPGRSHVIAFFSDLRRLTGGAPSPFFNAAQWLKYFELRGGMWLVRDGEALLLIPDGADLGDNMMELEVRGGKPAVLELIRARHEAQEA